MILGDDGTASASGTGTSACRLRGGESPPRGDRVHLSGLADRALHQLQEPQLPLPGPRPAPRPVLADLLEAERQHRLQDPARRRRRPLPGMDRQPPSTGSDPRSDARHLPPRRTTASRRPRPTVARLTTAPPPDRLSAAQTPVIGTTGR